MAYLFDGINQNLSTTSSPATGAPPITIAGFFNKTALSSTERFFITLGATSGGNWQTLSVINTTKVRLYMQGQGSGNQPTSDAAGSVSANTWGHALATSISDSSRIVYRDGANSASNAVTIPQPIFDRIIIASYVPSGLSSFDGSLAEVAIWTAELNSDEVSALNKGFKPSRIRPQSLVFYAPLIRNLQDIRDGRALTNNNAATVADHPRVY